MAERRTIYRPPYGFGCAAGEPVTDNDGVVHQTRILMVQDLAGDVVEIVFLQSDVETLIGKLRGVDTAPASALADLSKLANGVARG